MLDRKAIRELARKDPQELARKVYWDGYRSGLQGEAYYIEEMRKLNERVQNRIWESSWTEYWAELGEIMWQKLDDFRESLPPQERERLDLNLKKARRIGR